MVILVLGATGLLGQAVVAEASRRGIVVRTAARKDADIRLDMTDRVALGAVLRYEQPDTVFNCAALVDVGACDRDQAGAYAINAAPLAELATWCRASNAMLVHVSTDHFFAGTGPGAHDEDAPVTLFNAYAETKYAGERFALLDPTALVLRTSIVGLRGWDKPSFAEWAIDAIVNNRAITLFADAFTSSIDVGAFAGAALDLIDRKASGLFNLACAEVYSKEAFIQRLAAELGYPLDRATVGSVASLSPPRPISLGLDVGRAHALLGRQLPDLAAVVRAIADTYRSNA